MLKVPQLDDITYEQMMQRAISRIPAMTDEWTDFNSHDPGITVLQMYAWLTDMLNYYMNATGDIHVQKYLKLLGVEPRKERAAEGYVVLKNISEAMKIPKGTLFWAGDIPFETVTGQKYVHNVFCSFLNEVDGKGMDLTAFAGQDGEYAECFAEQFMQEAVLYLGFERCLSEGDSLYLCVDENQKRNPFTEDFRLCELEWQYYANGGWKTLEVEDETCGLLKSGFVKVHGVSEMKIWRHPEGMRKAFYIRCILRENKYDCLPRMGMVYVNPLKVVQQQTICQEGDFLTELKLGRTNGCAGQELDFDWPDVYSFSLALWSIDKNEKEQCEIWHCTEDLENAGYEDKVFQYDRQRKVIRFGDGIHGAVPMQNMPVSVTGLTCSRLDGGNVLAGEIQETSLQLPQGCEVWNPAPAKGGRQRETVPQMMERMENEIFVQNRMASSQDYEDRVLQTPGLMLELAHVIPGRVYGNLYRKKRGANEVVVVVKPKSTEKRPVLGNIYQKMIEDYIEPYRLVNTKISIVSPKYVGIEVHGKIALYQDTPEIRREIEEYIRNEVDYQRKKAPFGSVVAYGRLFTKLEALPGVRQVQELTLERIGNAASKNDRGDILLNEDALSFLEANNLEYCQ
ncbi:MAG: baseplate J/gp47 family protein [Lachnospiraceae bacterium]|nr:baseplate J/gp47 family protein [Lachnospiraceae bacterium]